MGELFWFPREQVIGRPGKSGSPMVNVDIKTLAGYGLLSVVVVASLSTTRSGHINRTGHWLRWCATLPDLDRDQDTCQLGIPFSR